MHNLAVCVVPVTARSCDLVADWPAPCCCSAACYCAQSWEGQCGQLDQYGMKLTRMFANLCNAGVQPPQLTHSLATGPCSGMP